MKRKVHVNHLQLGMHVVEVERPGFRSALVFDSFRLETPAQIDWLRRSCEYVYVDEPERDRPMQNISRRAPAGFARNDGQELDGSTSKVLLRLGRTTPYPEAVPLNYELPRAMAALRDARTMLDLLLLDARNGLVFDLAGTREVVEALMTSVLRNPNALTGLTQLKRREEYTAIHSLNVCIISLGFGRHLSLEEGPLLELGLGALLHDIGKGPLPDGILTRPGPLTAEEFELVKRHTEMGVDLVRRSGDIPNGALDAIYSHHERMNGTGYPRRVPGRTISLFARIVGLVDHFDAVTSHRAHQDGVGASTALRELAHLRGTLFDSLLVDEFVQFLGIYPVGSLVELKNGAVGIVSSANRTRRLQPLVTLVLDARKQELAQPRVVDLAAIEPAQRQGGYEISRTLEPESYGIDMHRYLLETIPRYLQVQ